MRRLLLLSLVLFGCTSQRTVWDGVYTAGQAARGRTVYLDHCAKCHNATIPAFNRKIKGSGFMEEWREDNLNSLFTQIKTRMPAENPSSLNDAEYLDVLTYILQENGFPLGRRELQSGMLEAIVIVSRDGPKPLPDGAMIQTSGCLTLDASKNWRLANATAFTRGRNRKEPGPDELKILDQQRPGPQTIELDTTLSWRLRGRGVDLSKYVGRKVFIRGSLQSAKSHPRVMPVLVQPTGSTCTHGG